MIQKTFKHNLTSLPSIDRIDGDETTGRLYRLPDGSKVPSVTTVLGWYKKPQLAEWRKRLGEEEVKKLANFILKLRKSHELEVFNCEIKREYGDDEELQTFIELMATGMLDATSMEEVEKIRQEHFDAIAELSD